MFALHRILLFLSFVCILLFNNNHNSKAKASQIESRKCAAFGEYCQNHWDCCSNSCMSFMWRCTRGRQQETQNPTIDSRFGSNEPVYATLNEIIETNFGKNTHTEPPTTVSFTSRFNIHQHQEDATTTMTPEYEQKTTNLPAKVEVVQRIQCKEIGVKCFSNNECCSQRCHGYLHQCVT